MPEFQLRSLDHVTLVVADLDRTRDFYVDALGLYLAPRPDFDFPGLWFHLHAPSANAGTSDVRGRAVLHAILANEEAGPPGPGTRGGTRPSRGHHIGFEVDDVEVARKHLDSCGIPIIHGPKRRPDGVTQMYLRDPDGYVIELFSV